MVILDSFQSLLKITDEGSLKMITHGQSLLPQTSLLSSVTNKVLTVKLFKQRCIVTIYINEYLFSNILYIPYPPCALHLLHLFHLFTGSTHLAEPQTDKDRGNIVGGGRGGGQDLLQTVCYVNWNGSAQSVALFTILNVRM